MQREILKNFINRSTAGGKKSSDDSGDLFRTTQALIQEDEIQDQIDSRRISRFNHISRDTRPSMANSGRITNNNDVFNLND